MYTLNCAPNDYSLVFQVSQSMKYVLHQTKTAIRILKGIEKYQHFTNPNALSMNHVPMHEHAQLLT